MINYNRVMFFTKLKNLFYLAVALIYLDVLEEILTRFSSTDSFMVRGSRMIAAFFYPLLGAFYWKQLIDWRKIKL